MQPKKNPLLIVLAVCGGCILLGIIIGVIGFFAIAKKGGPMINGMGTMIKTMPTFILDLKSKNYGGAASLVDPAVSNDLSAEKIQQMEEAVEKKLGPMQSFSPNPVPLTSNPQTDASGSMVFEYVYQYTLTYQKGTAKANLKFFLKNSSQGGGLVSGFTLEPTEPVHAQ
jgi:hypothetical protein